MRRRSNGFTLVEMLVVITIIGMLMALLLPAVQSAREAARQAMCTANQQNIGKAMQSYATGKNRFPPSMSLPPQTPDNRIVYAANFDARLMWGWVPPMLPELGQPAIYDNILNTVSGIYGGSQTITDYMNLFQSLYVGELNCPSDTTRETLDQPWISYYVNGGRANVARPPFGYMVSPNEPPDWRENGVMMIRMPALINARNVIREDQTNSLDDVARGDGTSMTLAVVENCSPRAFNPISAFGNTWSNTFFHNNTGMGISAPSEHHSAVLWHDANQYLEGGQRVLINQHKEDYLDPAHARPASYHPGLVIATFCDGHTRKISETIDYQVYCLLMSSNGRKTRAPATQTPSPNPAWQSRSVTEADLQQ